MVDGMKTMSYPERLNALNLPTLQHQRDRGDMIEIWKHFNDQSTLSPNFRPIPRTARGHRYQLKWHRARDEENGLQKNSFYFRVSNMWNLLPPNVVDAENIDIFKSRLDEAWKQSGNKFMIDESTQTEDHERFKEPL